MLGELVHQAMGETAAAINNAGEEEQVAYLLEATPTHLERAAMFAYYDPETDQVVVLRQSQAEVGRLSRLEAASFGQEVLAASRREETGSEPHREVPE